jgi:NAD(P)-dependent dehydrogenase (short-subunit alcohol dehydrogenase family)
MYTMMTVNTDKGIALITGASAGIATVYADRLAKAGYDLILVARNAERLRAIADRLTAGSGRSNDIIAADLTDAVCLARVESVLKSNVGITLLVNNAGVAERVNDSHGDSRVKGFILGSHRHFSTFFDIRGLSPFNLTRLVSEHDQTHIRSPFTTAAPIFRLRRAWAQGDETIL